MSEFKVGDSFKNGGLLNDSTDQQDTHYKKDVEPIDLIEAFDLDFCAGNVIKYVSRAKHKGNEKEDLRKAMYYLKRIIDGLQDS